MTDHLSIFAAGAVALYAAHHVGDYWVQTDHQARHKGAAGRDGRRACTRHVATYFVTQSVMLAMVFVVAGVRLPYWQVQVALLISGVTHWTADRREHGLMFWLARRIPGKINFLRLGMPRGGRYDDNPSLGTGAWALDQAWHIFWGVFVAALILAI